MNFLSIIFLVRLFAQQTSPSEILEKVRTNYSQLNDVSAQFTQTVKMKFRQTAQKKSGTIQLKKRNKFRIETEQQTIVTDGKTVWMYSPANKQVLVDTFKTNHQPFSTEQFLLGLPKDFFAESIRHEEHYIVINLKPTKTNQPSFSVRSLKIWVNPETWTVEKIEYDDKNNTVTFIELSDIRFNKGIDDKNFQFEISKEMKVVDLKMLR